MLWVIQQKKLLFDVFTYNTLRVDGLNHLGIVVPLQYKYCQLVSHTSTCNPNPMLI